MRKNNTCLLPQHGQNWRAHHVKPSKSRKRAHIMNDLIHRWCLGEGSQGTMYNENKCLDSDHRIKATKRYGIYVCE